MEQEILNVIQIMLNGISSTGSEMADRLSSAGMGIFLALVTMMSIWMFVQLMVDNSISLEELAPKLINHILNIAFVGLLLTSYTSGIIGVKNVFVNGSDYLVQQVTGKTSHDSFSTGLGQINDALARLNRNRPAPEKKGVDLSKLSEISNFSFTSVIFGSLMLSIANLAIAFSFVVYLSVYMLGLVGLYLGIIFGPFLIPWKLLDASSHLFDGWLRFTTTYALYKVVCSVVIAMLSASNDGLLNFVDKMQATGNTSSGYEMLYAVGVVICSMFMAFLLWQVPRFASGLVSGSGAGNAQWVKGGNLMGRFLK